VGAIDPPVALIVGALIVGALIVGGLIGWCVDWLVR
jgi:hypothetical protein